MNEFQKTYTSKYNFTLKNKNHHAKIQNFFKIKKMIKDKELKNEIWKTVKRTKTYTEFGSKHNALKHQAKRLKILPQIKKHYKIAN